MSVEGTANLVCNGFVHIIAVDEHSIKGGNSSLFARSASFKELRQQFKNARRITTLSWRFSCRKSYFSLCMRKSRNGIEHEHHIFALVTEIFGNSCCNIGSSKTGYGGLV